jgi:hypothetical protein
MVTVGLLVTLQARPGKEDELAGFLASALPLAQAEPETTAWFAIKIDDSTFGIADLAGCAAAPRRRALYSRSRSRLASSSGSPSAVSAAATSSALADAIGPTCASIVARVRPTNSSRSPLGSTFCAAADTRTR